MSNLLANVVAAVHICYFLFCVGGLFAILIGIRKSWRWIRNPWFRILHFVAVLFVVAEDILNIQCPLNVAEWTLRSETGSAIAVEATPGVGGVLDHLLRHTIPGSVLHIFYWSATALLIGLFFWIPPIFRQKVRR